LKALAETLGSVGGALDTAAPMRFKGVDHQLKTQ
jgi:hypothetical protein